MEWLSITLSTGETFLCREKLLDNGEDGNHRGTKDFQCRKSGVVLVVLKPENLIFLIWELAKDSQYYEICPILRLKVISSKTNIFVTSLSIFN